MPLLTPERLLYEVQFFRARIAARRAWDAAKYPQTAKSILQHLCYSVPAIDGHSLTVPVVRTDGRSGYAALDRRAVHPLSSATWPVADLPPECDDFALSVGLALVGHYSDRIDLRHYLQSDLLAMLRAYFETDDATRDVDTTMATYDFLIERGYCIDPNL